MTEGVIVGLDKAYEWAVKWWVDNYKKYNTKPLAFADFGMSPEIRKWCATEGIVYNLNQKLPHWFNKPLAIQQSPFDIVVWFDLDCEIKGNIDPIFEYAKKGFAVTKDIPARPPLQSGVVGTTKNNSILKKWVKKTIANYKSFRGDQEILNTIVKPSTNGIEIMPATYQWLRLQPKNDKAIVTHWTGHKGSNIIREKMGLKPLEKTKKRNLTKKGIKNGSQIRRQEKQNRHRIKFKHR